MFAQELNLSSKNEARMYDLAAGDRRADHSDIRAL